MANKFSKGSNFDIGVIGMQGKTAIYGLLTAKKKKKIKITYEQKSKLLRLDLYGICVFPKIDILFIQPGAYSARY